MRMMRIGKDEYGSCGENRKFKLLSSLLAPLMVGLALSANIIALERKQINLGPGAAAVLGLTSVPEVIASPEFIGKRWQGDYIYFGVDKMVGPIKWRVLNSKSCSNMDTPEAPEDSILLFAYQGLAADSMDKSLTRRLRDRFVGGNLQKMESIVAREVNRWFLGNGYFLAEERSSIKSSFVREGDNTDLESGQVLRNPSIRGQEVFLISAAEITNPEYGFLEKDSSSLKKSAFTPLRSYAVENRQMIGFGWYFGHNYRSSYGEGLTVLDEASLPSPFLVCPALNLARDSILLISEYNYSKRPPNLGKLPQNPSHPLADASVAWKLTLLDDEALVLPEIKAIDTSITDNKLLVTYSFEASSDERETESSRYLSAILVDIDSGALLTYGILGGIDGVSEEQGQLVLPNDYSKYTNPRLFIFVEENRGYISFASNPVEVPLKQTESYGRFASNSVGVTSQEAKSSEHVASSSGSFIVVGVATVLAALVAVFTGSK